MQRKLGLAAEAEALSPRVAQVQKVFPAQRGQQSPGKSPRQFTQFHSIQVLKSTQAEPETVVESERPQERLQMQFQASPALQQVHPPQRSISA